MDTVAVCSGRVRVCGGRVSIGDCRKKRLKLTIIYDLRVVPQSTQGTDGVRYFVPRVNTFRFDGSQLNFVNFGGTYLYEMTVEPATSGKTPDLSVFGVDVFAYTPQAVSITSDPVVQINQSSEQGGTQKKFQMIFSTDATVRVSVG